MILKDLLFQTKLFGGQVELMKQLLFKPLKQEKLIPGVKYYRLVMT